MLGSNVILTQQLTWGQIRPVTFICCFVSLSVLAPTSQSGEKDICSCYFCLCSARLGAAGETHLNANVLLFRPAKGQVNELVSKQKNTSLGRDVILMAAHQGRGIFQLLRAQQGWWWNWSNKDLQTDRYEEVRLFHHVVQLGAFASIIWRYT